MHNRCLRVNRCTLLPTVRDGVQWWFPAPNQPEGEHAHIFSLSTAFPGSGSQDDGGDGDDNDDGGGDDDEGKECGISLAFGKLSLKLISFQKEMQRGDLSTYSNNDNGVGGVLPPIPKFKTLPSDPFLNCFKVLPPTPKKRCVFNQLFWYFVILPKIDQMHQMNC